MSDEGLKLSKKAQVNVILKDACDAFNDISTIILSSSDGHVAGVYSTNKDLDHYRVSAMAASFTGLSYAMANETRVGSVSRASIKAQHGLLLSQLLRVGKKEFVLTMIFDNSVKVGMAHWALNNISKNILEIF